jgi:hypothetical protein
MQQTKSLQDEVATTYQNDVATTYQQIQSHIRDNLYNQYNKNVLASTPTYREHERDIERIVSGSTIPQELNRQTIANLYEDTLLYTAIAKELDQYVQDGTYQWLIQGRKGDDPNAPMKRMSASVFPHNVNYLKELVANLYVQVVRAEKKIAPKQPMYSGEYGNKLSTIGQYLI